MNDRPDENTPIEELHGLRKGYQPGTRAYEDAGFELQRRQMEALQTEVARLKKPHWTVLPNFWFTVIGAIAALLAAYLAWLTLKPSATQIPPTESAAPANPSP